MSAFFSRPLHAFALFVCLAGACATAQTPDELAQRADQAYQEESWQLARDAYDELVALNPESARGWYRLGVAERYLGNYDAAAAALARSQEAGVPAAFVEWEVAKLYAARADNDGALEHLRAAIDAGFSNVDFLETSPDFDKIRGTDAYQAIVADARKLAAPCMYTPEYRQFDFWTGDWIVTDRAGTEQGRNSVRPAQNGCVLIENWKSASGTTGMSINYYDPVVEKWIQQWISSGAQIRIEGGIADGSMVLTGYIYTLATNTKADFRGTWTLLRDGRVRQFFEQSTDGGAAWQPWFEGFYARQPE